jgi:aminopeptidase YwaD
MKKTFLLVACIAVMYRCFSQDAAYAKKLVDTLTSAAFWGRGYTNDGMSKAADFIAAQFAAYGVQPMKGKNYKQNFSYPANIFPNKMEVAINGKELVPGKDFIVSPESRGIKAVGALVQKDTAQFIDAEPRVVVVLKDKLTWSVEQVQQDYTVIFVDKKSLSSAPASIKVNIDASFNKSFKAANVCGMVAGKVKPDSFVVVTAHYDHLGGMGKDTYFPGANDNASGISLLLSLAKYYAANPPAYSVAFIAFAGEEAGLVGSKYFTENPLLRLKSVRFLTNVDLVGTGIDGITVVNATEYANEFALLNKINEANKYLLKINARGKAANSDHYWFTEKGVPAFFLYTLGGIAAYHDVFDKAATLPLTEFTDLFNLIVSFNQLLMQ